MVSILGTVFQDFIHVVISLLFRIKDLTCLTRKIMSTSGRRREQNENILFFNLLILLIYESLEHI